MSNIKVTDGAKTYAGTVQPRGCTPGTASVTVTGGMGGLTDSSYKGAARPNKYELHLGINESRVVTVQCGDPPSSVQLPVIFQAGKCPGAAAILDQSYTDINRLSGKGSWSCPGGTNSAEWDFQAQDR